MTNRDATRRRAPQRFPSRAERAPSRIATAGGLLLRGDQVLLALRHRSRANQPGVWDMPGGHVEPCESPRQALRRELREELGIDAVLAEPWRHIVDTDLQVELTVWLVRRWTGALINAAEDEHETIAWFKLPELATLAFPHPAYPALLADALTT